MSYLGIDLGTSGLRALLVDAEGRPIASVQSSYGVSNPAPGWSEQDPADWIAALDHAILELRAKYSQFQELRGIGVAGHMHGATLLDAENNVLRPCILWNDTRAASQADEIDRTEGAREASANIVFPGFTAPKLRWIEANEPAIFGKIAKVLLPAAYLNLYLTGEHVADLSDSAGTAWLDVERRDWSDALLSAGHMTHQQMPRLVEGSERAGTVRKILQDRWGVRHPIVVCGGAGDNAAAACGIGALNEGEGFVSLGTSGVVLVAREAFSAAPETAVHTFCHAVPDKWYQMGVMLSATDSLNWLSRITGVAPVELTKALGPDLRSPSTVRFLPYLSGERTPHNDSHIRGSFTGLATSTDRNDLTRAVLEGVSFGLKDSLEALKATGAKVETLMAIGGGSASIYWLKVLASVLGVPLKLPAGREFGAALGAARLAILAATQAVAADVMTAPETGSIIAPEGHLVGQFEDAYQGFRSAYPKIKSIQ